LRTRFLILPLFMTALLGAGLLFWLLPEVSSQQTSELIRRGQLAAEVLDKSAIGALSVYDQNALDQIAKGFIRSNDFLYIVFLDKDRKILADSGLQPTETASIQALLPELLASDGDARIESVWPRTVEPVIHISRPIFFEQLRLGTVVLGISGRRLALQKEHLRMLAGILCGALFVVGLGLSIYFHWQLSRRLKQIALGFEDLPDEQLEVLAGKVREFNDLVEQLQKQRNLFKSSLSEIESQKFQLEGDLTQSREQASSLNLRLGSMAKQIEGLQEKLRVMEEQSRHLTNMLPIVEFATNIAPEIDTSMRHIAKSAEQLNEDLGRVRNLIDLYEKALPQTPEDLEVIRQYRAFINYERIREAMEELVATIRGGASWSEQLADILKQLSSSSSSVSQAK